MQISRSFASSLMRGFSPTPVLSMTPENEGIEHSTIVKAFITIDKGSCLIPTIAHDIFLYSGSFGNHTGSADSEILETTTDVVIPLYVGQTETHRTTDSILKTLILPARTGRLTKVITSKNEVFYGGHGVILEEDGTPILLTKTTWSYRRGTTKGVLCISPKVFSMDNIVYKGILSKIVPVYLGIIDHPSSIKFTLSVEDIQGFSKPQLVNNSIKESCRTANQFLKDNIGNVFL